MKKAGLSVLVFLMLATLAYYPTPAAAWGVSTKISITATPTTVPAGQKVTLTITELNNGDCSSSERDLSSAFVVLDPGGTILNNLSSNFSSNQDFRTACYNAGHTNDNPPLSAVQLADSTLQGGEAWQWTVTVPVSATTTFVVKGYGTSHDGNLVNPNDFPSEQASTTVTVGPPPPPPPACTINGVTISDTSWNKFNIPSGTSPVVWLNAHIGKPGGVPNTGITTVKFTNVSLTVNGTSYPVPDGVLTFDPSAPANISTTLSGGKWSTLINPNYLSDEIFFTGAAIPVTAQIAAGGKATFSYNVQSSAPNLSMPWQWSAAVYTLWPADWNGAMIQPYHQSYHAGTPLNTAVQKSLIQGPRGGGGSNFTGSWSATSKATCP